MTLDEAMELTRQDVADELDGLPPIKMHCSNLAADALHIAIKNYRKARGEVVPDEHEKVEEEIECLIGKDEFLNKGVYLNADKPEEFENRRTLVLYSGDKSVEMAIKLTEVSGRVILLTPDETLVLSPELAEKLAASTVKVLYQSRLLEIRGKVEVEKALIRNLDENEDYELFVDAVIIIE
jgi:nitrogen fixation NifU-like protein